MSMPCSAFRINRSQSEIPSYSLVTRCAIISISDYGPKGAVNRKWTHEKSVNQFRETCGSEIGLILSTLELASQSGLQAHIKCILQSGYKLLAQATIQSGYFSLNTCAISRK